MIRVLCVEDDPIFASLVRFLFEHSASEIALEIVPTGHDCLDRMRRGGIDVLLLDLNLPDIDGLRVLGELAIRGDRTPVIMVSGQDQIELAVKALRAGAADCLDKQSPRFRQVVEITKRLHARHQASSARLAPSPEPNREYRVVLSESSASHRRDITDFFFQSVPSINLLDLVLAADLSNLPPEVDAVLLGTIPAGDNALNLLRALRSRAADLPVILLGPQGDAETTVAAFTLGARDYISRNQGYLTELVFSLSRVLAGAKLTRHNTQLTRELEAINRSIEAQVETRTRELEARSRRLIRAREDERHAIARELHDQIGPMLTGLKFQLEAAATQAGPPVRDKLTEALALATDLLDRVRELTLRLRPPILDDLGLQPALPVPPAS